MNNLISKYKELAIICSVLIIIYFVWIFPEQWIYCYFGSLQGIDKINAISSFRGAILQLFGGSVILATAIITYIKLKTEKKLNEDRLTLEQYQKAIEHLKDDKIEARIGGIYSLEKIMNENEYYHWKIVEILSTFIRNKRSKKKYEKIIPDSENLDDPDIECNIVCHYEIPVEMDIQTALTVLGKRNMKFEESDENDDKHIDLSYTNLYHADFVGLHFEKTIFAESILTSRKYYNTYFNKANFYLADFKNSVLKYSHFEESNLNQTNLENTDSFMNYYNKAELTEANFKNSKIKKSFFQDNYFDYTNFTQ
jgi:hypothetical protein